ncbi:hypothetical protein BpHYR1_030537 [Brachionus plicatilis]|uniref:Uncharacterized protein n=1 Tax=Brachionus plicatilis TaxID=10195 RepID=A0A3M7P3M5_BRAPC|nr:hypothetical protein BpHYR1_030537 [Brachionus plicatilis]
MVSFKKTTYQRGSKQNMTNFVLFTFTLCHLIFINILLHVKKLPSFYQKQDCLIFLSGVKLLPFSTVKRSNILFRISKNK